MTENTKYTLTEVTRPLDVSKIDPTTSSIHIVKWISVKDQLPKVEGDYLTFYPDKYGNSMVCIRSWLHWANGFSWYYSWNERCDEVEVTHWMPLPKPPKTEKEEKT